MMSEVNWNALMNMPNAGAAFTNAFQGAQQQQRQDAMQQQQMAEHQEDRQFKAHERALKDVEAHRDAIKTGAAIIREVQPRDDASWQQALGLLQDYGINPQELGVPMQFDPQYVQGVVSLADALDPPKQAAQPNIAKEVDYYRSIGRDDLAQQLLTNHANPMISMHNDDGTITLARPPVQGGQAPPPPPGFVIDGGPAGAQPGGFR